MNDNPECLPPPAGSECALAPRTNNIGSLPRVGNYGLFCFPGGKFSIQEYKVKTILDAIIEDGWSEVHFYEDKKDWLYAAKEAVNNAFPEVVFYPHLITIEKHM